MVATLKHFAGYSASRGGRNLAPVSIGPRELADVLLPPFEMALRAGARSVMNSYCDIDGVPVAADPGLLTGRLRDDYGFTGTVVSDYFSVGSCTPCTRVAGTRAERGRTGAAGRHRRGTARRGLLRRATARGGRGRAGRRGPGGPGRRAGAPPEMRAGTARRGLGRPGPDRQRDRRRTSCSTTSQSRALAREVARRSIVLLRNDGTLPLPAGARIAVVGPRADEASAMLGCYSFPRHVGVHHPEIAMGIEVPTVLAALRADPAGYEISYAQGCPVLGGHRRPAERGGGRTARRRRLRRGARRPGRPVRRGHLR